jgi:hypothetical protein
MNGRSVDGQKEKAYVLPALSYALPAFVTVKDGKVQSIKNAIGIEGIKEIHANELKARRRNWDNSLKAPSIASIASGRFLG